MKIFQPGAQASNALRSHRTKCLAGLAAAVAFTIPACSPNPIPSERVSSSELTAVRPTQVDVPYKPGASLGCDSKRSDEDCGGSQTFDLYLPRSGAPKGTIMFIHGGGFTGGDKSKLEDTAAIFRQLDSGWAVVNVNYLLTKGTKNVYPSQMLDLRAAANYLSKNAGGLGIDMSKFVVAGHSGGGTLASLIGVGHNSNIPAFKGFPKVAGWVSISGIADFNLDNLSGMWGRRWMTNTSFAALSVQASPVTHFDRSDPKGYWIHGSQDTLVPVAAASTMHNKSVTGGFAHKFQVDLVDQQKSGAPLPSSVVGHSPTGGANTAELTRWFNALIQPR